MLDRTIVLKREDLFVEVWAEPVATVAKRYSISDVALRKICIMMNIPLPARGYWQKGRTDKPALPPLKPGVRETYTLGPKPRAKTADEAQDPETQALIDREMLPKNKITVAPRPTSPHPLIVKTRTALEKVTPDAYGLLFAKYYPGALNVTISPKSTDRALSILDALLKALQMRGYKVEVNRAEATIVVVLGESIEICMKESLKTWTQDCADEHLNRNSESNGYGPSGHLELCIVKQHWAWADEPDHPLEDQLNDFVVGLTMAANTQKGLRESEEHRLQAKEMFAEIEERSKLKHLLRDVDNWELSRRIREYVEAVKQAHGEVDPESKLGRWIVWATEQADLLDTIKNPPPEVDPLFGIPLNIS